ncbi:hypothetical protein ACS0TY_027592 [Phlomoides rotata]
MAACGKVVAPNLDKGKAVRGRRSRTKAEEDALIHCLIDIVNDGWKAENGFKAGFLRELEKNMRKMLPGTNIMANPHIHSKIHVSKKEYGALSDLLSKSGIGWNSTTSMIEVHDEDVWDTSKQADPSVKGIHFKTWPYYDKWLEVFGKDRATGENAIDPTDLVNEMLRTSAQEQEGDTAEKFMPVPSDKLNVMEDYSYNAHFQRQKKKSCGPRYESSSRVPGMFMTQSDSKIGDIAREIGSGKEKPIDNKRLNEIMGRIVGLKMADKLKVCDELVQNTNRLDFFMSLTAEE